MKIFKEMKDNLESPEAGAPRQCRGPRVAAVVGEKFLDRFLAGRTRAVKPRSEIRRVRARRTPISGLSNSGWLYKIHVLASIVPLQPTRTLKIC